VFDLAADFAAGFRTVLLADFFADLVDAFLADLVDAFLADLLDDFLADLPDALDDFERADFFAMIDFN